MKYHIKITAMLGLALGIVSCKDNLEESPYSSLSKEVVFKDEDGLNQATIGVYQAWTAPDFSDISSRFILTESGHRYATAGILGSGSDPYYRFGHVSTSGAFEAVWSRFYKIIFRANTVIDNAARAVPGEEEEADPYIAEARFLRAYAYFNLVRLFGGVPLLLKEINSLSDEDLIFAPRETDVAVYEAIIADLTFAEANLPDSRGGAELGRVSAGTAKAMLGKVYLTMAGKPLNKTENYQKAVDKFSEIVGPANEEKFDFELIPDFAEVFSLDNERNREIVLSFGYFVNSSNPNGNILPFNLFPSGLVNGDEQTNYGLTYDFYKLFEKTDTRRPFTLVDRYIFKGGARAGAEEGDSIIYNPEIGNYVNKRTKASLAHDDFKYGIAYGKLARVARPAGAAIQGYSADLIELRFSDVLLCYAEALVETGKTAQALPILNRVRDRAKATPSKATAAAALRTAIRTERRLELTGEMTTVFDIRRWGTLQQEIAAMSEDQIVDNVLIPYSPRLELYPVPQSQIDANPNLRQNDGW
ncbi:RagB/SusD family nutrient uptake outer membrane protein [Dyadobacter chenhuakuii]|uniref:RagB/SusD family nutrient uptake outer membrane protein n=1 Tax=Dyadobacter chenhuakuii TaxID=2909339 RepID=A0ABY4XQG2_9BACT|nr:RagB/SusD family nutrient uptake outer membrane protein [Dyadobacter chenhuakuii]MCF2493380.1 RagB/SusD family nutrient uptake outer membrane protein [Dyadobacter chenhuakuii]USJ32343.1 RagB/SusD family nutrient uptake outer membrane protein [Dyadobacter chenhuakuii]